MIKWDTVCTVSILIRSHHGAARLQVSYTGAYPPDMKGNPLSLINKMQHYTIFFIAVNALHVSGGFSASHQELKLYTQHLVYVKLACCYS
jgi:hypothetical protein